MVNSVSKLDFRSASLGHLTILLLLGGQVEMNPGPSTHETSQQVFPCVIYAVQEDDPAIVCDDCGYWCHISCLGISSHSFKHLSTKSRSFAWNCSSVVLQTLDPVLRCKDMILLIQIAFPLLKVPSMIQVMTKLVLDQTVH